VLVPWKEHSLWFITNTLKLRTKKFYTIGPQSSLLFAGKAGAYLSEATIRCYTLG